MSSAAQCDGKVAFDSPKLANLVIKRRKSRRLDKPGHPYRCRVCGFWHIGNVKTDKMVKLKGPRP